MPFRCIGRNSSSSHFPEFSGTVLVIFLFALGAGFRGRRGSLDFEEDLGSWTRIFESSVLMQVLIFRVHLGSIFAMLPKFQHVSGGQIGPA